MNRLRANSLHPCNVTITIDLEDPRPNPGLPDSFVGATRELIDLLAELKVSATFFVIADLATSHPELVRGIADAGHEIALHGLDHTPLTSLTPTKFDQQTRRAKAIIEEITGRGVTGFRAPIFSLTPATLWAESLLTDQGFSYSSSLLPGRHPFFNFADAPTEPFRWPSGLLEIPSPLTQLGPLDLPFLGGIYFRYLPYWYIRRCLDAADATQSLWFYSHPHDFDHRESFYRIKNTPYWMSLLLWLNRKGTLGKLRRLLQEPAITIAAPFADQVAAGQFAQAATFQPAADAPATPREC